MEIRFTQYLRPNGRASNVFIDRPNEVALKTAQIVIAGYGLVYEILADGYVSLRISDDKGDYAFELCENGPEIPNAVDRLVMRFELLKPQTKL